MTAKGHSVSFWSDENILELEVVVTPYCECAIITYHRSFHFPRVHFRLCEFHFNEQQTATKKQGQQASDNSVVAEAECGGREL